MIDNRSRCGFLSNKLSWKCTVEEDEFQSESENEVEDRGKGRVRKGEVKVEPFFDLGIEVDEKPKRAKRSLTKGRAGKMSKEAKGMRFA